MHIIMIQTLEGVNLGYCGGGRDDLRLPIFALPIRSRVMIGNDEIWDRASAVERIHGDRSEEYVAERIASCRREAHAEALQLWEEIDALLRDLHRIHQPLKPITDLCFALDRPTGAGVFLSRPKVDQELSPEQRVSSPPVSRFRLQIVPRATLSRSG